MRKQDGPVVEVSARVEPSVDLDENVIDPQQFANGPLRGLSPVGSAITGLIPGDVAKTLDAATRSGAAIFRDASKKTGDPFRAFMQTLEETKKP